MMRIAVLLAMVALLVLTGCATVKPVYQDSHQVMLEKTVEKMDVTQALSAKVPAGASVAVVSMETMTTTDHPVIALVEDGLMELILEAGYVPIERDVHLLKRLFHERADGKYGIPVLLDSLVVREPYRLPVLDTDLSAAGYLISYRVLEAGIRYGKAESMGKTKREAVVRLNVRIEQAPDGDILWAGEMNGEFSDEIDSALVMPLSDYHYSFFGHRLPLQKKQVTKRSLWSPTPKRPVGGSAKSPSDGISTFGFGMAQPTGDFGEFTETGPGLSYQWLQPVGDGLFMGISEFLSYHSLDDRFFSDGRWVMLEVMATARYQSPSGGYGMLGLGANHSRLKAFSRYYDPELGYSRTYTMGDNASHFAWCLGGGIQLNEQWDVQALLHSIESGNLGSASRYLTFTAGVYF